MPVKPTSCSLKQKIHRQWLGVLFTAPSVAALAIAASASGLFQVLEWTALDRYFHLRPPEPIDPRIVIVTIDESDIKKVGQWPIPDAVLAKAINNIKAQKPNAIGLDLYRDLPVPPGSEALTQIFKSTPNLIGVEKQVADRVAPSPTLNKLNQVALADLVLDADGKVRRGLMSVRADDGTTKLSLGARLSLIYLESKDVNLRVVDAKKKQLGLGKAVFQPLNSNDGGYIKADAGGYQILLNFRGSIRSFQTLSFADVLENRIPGGRDSASAPLRDRIILMGATGQSLNDLFLTPYSDNQRGSSERTPGVVIHANLISQILSAAIDGRPLIYFWSEPLEWLWIFFWSGCGATIASIFPRKRWGVASIVFMGCSLLGGSYVMFLHGWWIPVIAPLLALLGAAVANTCYILIENLKLSHQQLEEYSRTLEVKVKERTLELEQKTNQLEQQAVELAAAKEAALAGSAAKSAFLANMSHEFRTPLNAILGFSQLMVLDDSLSEENIEQLEIISRSGKHLLALINDVLEMSKIESGVIELKESKFNLHHLLSNVKAMLELKAKSKDLQLILDFGSDVPQSITTDERKLQQVLLNLLGNAVKFTEKGRVTMRVSLLSSQKLLAPITTEESSKIRLLFEVEDTGLGIAPDEIDLLFQAFMQTKTGRQSGQGTGLGLSISRKFVQLMGGDITVSSTVGQGTTFQFDIQAACTSETTTLPSQPEIENITDESLERMQTYVQNPPQTQNLLMTDLSLMPTEWLEQLHHATAKGSDALIYQLIEQIPESNTTLATALRELAHNYHFEQILESIPLPIPNLQIIQNTQSLQTIERTETRTVENNDEAENVKGSILIVDDIPENLLLLSTMLKQQGHQIREVTDGLTALTVAQTNPPDLILLDITMPDMDGYQVCEHLKLHPITAEIPIIFISAMNEVADKVKGFKVGGADYITKPFQLEEVLARVENQLTINQLKKQLTEQNSLLRKEVSHRIEVEQSLRQSEAQEREKSQQLAQTLQKLTQAQMQLIQQEKMSSLGQLVAGIAHEINNPVNFIYGNLEPLQVYNQDLLKLVKLYQIYYPNPHPEIQKEIEAIDLDFLVEDATKILQSMETGIERILEIIKSLRIFSRLDEAEVKIIDIHEGIESTLMILQHRLKAQVNQLPIDVIKEYGDLPKVECYAGQLNQVFLNILSNAIDALEDRRNQQDSSVGKPQIRIRTELLNAERVAIYIADNGIGMNEIVQQRLFDPFFTTKEVGKGTGLGLSISYQIAVDRHGGEIRCISAPGQGSMFVIELPAQQLRKEPK